MTTGYECVAIADPEDFAALEPEWRALHVRTKTAYLTEGFTWSQLCWDRLAAPAGRELLCLIVRRQGRLAAVWPLTLSRRGACRIAAALANLSSEYSPLLIDAAADRREVWRVLLAELERARVDVLQLPHVREDSLMACCLRGSGSLRISHRTPAPFVRASAFGGWDSYWPQLPHKVRDNVSRNWRRARRLGEVRCEEIFDRAEREAVWWWMVAHKREWVKRNNLRSPSMQSDWYPRFIASTLGLDDAWARRSLFVLRLDGQIIAAELSNVDQQRMELCVLTFDYAFAQCAPGNLLRAESLRWALDRGLDYDFRMGAEGYKAEWASDVASVALHELGLTSRGKAFVAYLGARHWAADRTPWALRDKVKALLP